MDSVPPVRLSVRTRTVVVAVLALALVVTGALVARRGRRARDATPSPAMAVLFSGCARVRVGPVCELKATREIRLWLPADFGSLVAVDVAGTPVSAASTTPVRGGVRFATTVPMGATRLEVHVRTRGESSTFALAVTPLDTPAWFEEVRALFRAGKLDEALARAVEIEAKGAGVMDTQRVLFVKSRVWMAQGKAAAAEGAFRESVAFALANGLLSDAADDSFALAYLLSERQHRVADARTVLDAIAGSLSGYPDGEALASYHRALLSSSTGNPRRALPALEEAIEKAERLGHSDAARGARETMAMELGQVGRHAEALEILRAIDRTEDAQTPSCLRLVTKYNIAFSELLSLQSTGDAVADADARADAVRLLQEAADLDCAETYRTAGVLAELATALAQAGKATEGRRCLERARALAPDAKADLGAGMLHADGTLAMAEGDPRRALRAFEEEQRIAHAEFRRAIEWSAVVGRASALEALGELRPAADAYSSAEEILDDLVVAVPLGEGRGTFLADRSATARARVDLLLRLGDTASALAAMRGSQRRVIASLAAARHLATLEGPDRARWEEAILTYRRERAELDDLASRDDTLSRQSAESARAARTDAHARLRGSLDAALAALRMGRVARAPLPSHAQPGTLVLAYHPLPHGWAGIAVYGATLRAARIDDFHEGAAPEALAAQLFAPFADLLAAAPRVQFLPYGAAGAIDLHALPFAGAPLVTTHDIEFAIGSDAFAAEAEPTRVGALVVADPTSDLPAAWKDGEAISALLESGRRPPVIRLMGRDATREELQRGFATSRMFFFSGHGVHAGSEGLDSALVLARHVSITAGDVLAMPNVPPEILLAACEAGKAESTAPAPGLGIAQAFLVAGARSVIAPTRPVRDGDAAILTRASVASLAPGASWDAAAALAAGQREMRRLRPNGDWAAFRAFVP